MATLFSILSRSCNRTANSSKSASCVFNMEQCTSLDHQNISTELLRQKIRDYALQDRNKARANANDALRFGLGDIKTHIDELTLTEKDVQGLASRIKRRKHATEEDMYRLNHAFLLSTGNINAFANTQGALQVLVKELTGSNSERQISAIECICNLSLGELHVCEKICKMCGSYLVTYLDSSEKRLKQTSLWTICNLLATGDKCAENLLKLELLRKLCSIYVCIENVDYCEDAGICLQLLCSRTNHLFNEESYKFIIEKLMQKTPASKGSEYQLQIIFNSNILKANNIETCDTTFLAWLMKFALSSLHNSTDMAVASNRLKVVYAIRIIANALASQYSCLNILRSQLTEHWRNSLNEFLKFLFDFVPQELVLEVLWLTKNLMQSASQLNEDLSEIEATLAALTLPQNIIQII